MKSDNKKAFTLAELLLVLGIVSILTAVSVAIMRPQEASRKAAVSVALTTLDSAMYNAYIGIPDNVEGTSEHPFSESNKDKPENYQILCKALARYVNTIEDVDATDDKFAACKGSAISTFDDDSIFSKDKRNTYLEFTTTSGMQVFISKRIKPSDSEDDNFFYLVYVDINGSKLPNTTIYKSKTALRPAVYPDIYVFAVIPLGRVIPLGILENDSKLLTAKANQIVKKEHTEPINGSTTYAKAKSQAWGFYTTKKNVEVDISNQGDNGVAMEEEPYAYNDYVRRVILGICPHPTFYKNIDFFDNQSNNEDFKCCKEFNENDNNCKTEFGKDEFYDGSCSIQIDTYSY